LPSTQFVFISNRYGQWHKDKGAEPNRKNVPRIMVYIMGGFTLSEARAGYEVTNDKKNWEVIVGKISAFFLLASNQIIDVEIFHEKCGICYQRINRAKIDCHNPAKNKAMLGRLNGVL